jgi:general secretion pathway protein E
MLGDILVRRGKVTAEQWAAAAAQQRQPNGRPADQVLIESGVLTEDALLDALGDEFELEVMRRIPDDLLDPSLVERLPVEWARTHALLPFRWKGRPAVLAADPTALDGIENLALLIGDDLQPVLAPRREILKAIERCYYRRTESAEDVIRDLAQPATAGAEVLPRGDDLLRTAEQAPVTQLANVILLEAVKAGASDVHIEPFETRLRVRYRVDGLLYDQASPPKHLESSLVSRLKVMAHMDIAEKRLPQDGAARVRVGERELDIRVSTVPVAEGERVVLRLLSRESALLPLDALGMPAGVLARFRECLREPNGIVLVTGPTGSGKTTTLYAALRELDTAHANVLTIEDPIEYQLPSIGQMQVKPKIGLTFAQGLRHILRQDPDIILVGETRDLETAEIVVRASLTGHLVFTTLHTNDAAGAVVRLVDMGIAPYLLAPALKGALAQRLVRRLCVRCRRETALSRDDARLLGAEPAAGSAVFEAVGCPECLGGFRGRTGVYELLAAGGLLERAVREGPGLDAVRRAGREQGMTTLLDDARDKVLSGVTSAAEVGRVMGHRDAGPRP